MRVPYIVYLGRHGVPGHDWPFSWVATTAKRCFGGFAHVLTAAHLPLENGAGWPFLQVQLSWISPRGVKGGGGMLTIRVSAHHSVYAVACKSGNHYGFVCAADGA